MKMTRAQGALLLGGYVTYVVMGSFVFELLENDHHQKIKQDIFQMKEEFFLNYTSLKPADVNIFIQKLIIATQMGIDPIGTEPHDKQGGWDFINSFFFVGSMLATIGYGYLSPRTKEGQLFCVVFALFGIPFYFICLNYVGFLVSGIFESCAKQTRYRKRDKKSARYIFMFVFSGLIIFLILPSFFFQWMEGWEYYEAVYFTFVTLSTIGFGDYLIGRQHDRDYFMGYRMVSSFWIVMGLAWITVLFDLTTSLLTPVNPKARSKKGTKRHR